MTRIFKIFIIGISILIVVPSTILLINYVNATDISKTDRNLKDVLYQLNYLEDQLKNHDLGNRMQDQFPEGFVFIHVLYGLAWAEIANSPQQDIEIERRAKIEAKYAFEQINSAEGREDFNESLQPAYGIFYRGWTNYLLGKILITETSPDSLSLEVFKNNCKDIAGSISDTIAIFPPSYSEACWPADALVGVASLKLYTQLFKPGYDSIIYAWVTKVKSKVDITTHMIPHSVDFRSGEMIDPPRGSSMSLMLIFLSEIDSLFAQEQFKLFSKHFRINRFGFPAIREFLPRYNVVADYDSGPVILDISFPGSIVSIGVFKKFGDAKTANMLFRTFEGFSIPYQKHKRKKYLFGAQPIVDAFIAWARVQT